MLTFLVKRISLSNYKKHQCFCKGFSLFRNQLSNYLKQLLEEGNNEYHGILTDGVKLKYAYFQDGKLHTTSFKNIDESDLDKLVQFLSDINKTLLKETVRSKMKDLEELLY